MAVTNSTVVAVGTDAEVLKLQGPHTRVVDLLGAFVLPGFNDAHTHMAAAGQQKLSVDLDGTPSLADMLERIRIYTAAALPGQWILGAGWDHTAWASKTLPTRQDLDKVTAGHPAVFLSNRRTYRGGELGGAAGCRDLFSDQGPGGWEDRPGCGRRAYRDCGARHPQCR